MKRLLVFAALFIAAYPLFGELAQVVDIVSGEVELRALGGELILRFKPQDGPQRFEVGQLVIAEFRCRTIEAWGNCKYEEEYQFLVDGHPVDLAAMRMRFAGKGRVHHGPADKDGDGSVILETRLASGKHCADFCLIPLTNGSVSRRLLRVKTDDEIGFAVLERKPYRAVAAGTEMKIASVTFYRCEQ